ncbi:GGDEF domain-containing protein [Streptomyces goshikiensis]|uniref:GGDEF domain-containing protein n=1 Tax=Streptomyces goshikiensis TaxID=1942 RepID=UPI00368DA371
MDSVLHARGRIGSRALLVTTAAVPLTGWAVHAVALRKQIADGRKDPLTGLLGRPELLAHVRRQLRRHRDGLHVLMLDGIGFKAVNDTFGHAGGDAAIQTVGRRLASWSTGRRALAARLGGDEFAVSVVLDPATALSEVTALREQLQQPFPFEQHTLHLGVTVGIARAADLPGEDASRILRGADTAMYKVKKGTADFPYCATRADAYTQTVNGRRVGRPGTHLLAGAA